VSSDERGRTRAISRFLVGRQWRLELLLRFVFFVEFLLLKEVASLTVRLFFGGHDI